MVLTPLSWYEASARPHPVHPPLDGDASVDLCVVGAGLTGLSAALEAAGRGWRVMVLDRARVGAGASGRNGGQVITGYNLGIGDIACRVGSADAALLWRMNLEATGLLVERVARHDIACDLRWGHVAAALKPRHLRDIDATLEEYQDLGYGHARPLDRDGIRAIVVSDRYIGGLADDGSAHLHPLDYTLGLAAAAVRAGAVIHETTEVTGLIPGAPAAVVTDRGTVQARHVILAGNAYLSGVVPAVEGHVMPAATYMLATEPLGRRAADVLRADVGVCDMKMALDYFRLSADRRLLFGGAVSYSGRDPRDLMGFMRRTMLKVFPQLADVAIDHAWGGRVAITRNRLPHFGRVAPNILFAHGFSGHGLALSGLAGKLMAEALCATAERFDVFARLPHAPFPGGRRWRRPLLVAAMTWARLRDLL